ncbi:MAG: DNA primase DnaG [Candidatus Lokiarchaeota archaeon]
MSKITEKNSHEFTTKYIIETKFKIKGVVEKSDIVGAVFGQTEGLLLDLDLRDLQKSGRIGRIEVTNESEEGVSNGVIRIPSSLTRKETALLAATVETVNRVGPCEAEIILVEIRDVRERKRKKIIERAAELLKEWDEKSLDAAEIEEKIDNDINLSDIISWGSENLPAGPDVEEDPDLILVEGRADVLNLLRIGVKNTIAVQGTQIPKSVLELMKNKETVTAFLDGDRGGTIILKELMQLSKLNYIARAPEGYEVEELTRKQMIKALQNKKPIDSVSEPEITEPEVKKKNENDYHGKEKVLFKFLKKLKIKDKTVIFEAINNLKASEGIGFDQDLKQLFTIPVNEVYDRLKGYPNARYLILDGILSKRLLDLAKKMNIKFIACKNKIEDLTIPNSISVYYI